MGGGRRVRRLARPSARPRVGAAWRRFHMTAQPPLVAGLMLPASWAESSPDCAGGEDEAASPKAPTGEGALGGELNPTRGLLLLLLLPLGVVADLPVVCNEWRATSQRWQVFSHPVSITRLNEGKFAGAVANAAPPLPPPSFNLFAAHQPALHLLGGSFATI